ncbi:RluA family pseudouridine synthase [Catellicoccus marimammalium]|uniref:Pseudouridine synthase n=1 Tax=Catellicoccus marimammalium M35/04/3 TaxID=1234409 RepID=K8ZB62_9ENTE|nr:RluA family pseudouridine synthase [Catellicoccus marimammalium]EKU27287.1 Ribosomal large subunit pseudouridine synthase D [Catellicoccus marimammalium M35/04/3]
MTEKQYTITTEKGRIDKVLANLFPEYTRSKLQTWVKEGIVTVNGKPTKSNYKVATGDQISFTPQEDKPLTAEPQNIPLDIIYEDEDVIVINKPQGMVVHPSPGHPDGTLVNGLLYHTQLSEMEEGTIRPGIVHRIDKDTSGLLMVAKNNQSHESLAKQLSEKTSHRRYLAIVHGDIDHAKGKIDAPIGRDPKDRKKQAVIKEGRPAVTHFEVLERFGRYTLIACQLETGRTHQIRVHMNYIGHPLAGDPLYGPKKTLAGEGQFLHAQELGFEHPTTGEWMQFSVEPPKLFQETLEKLRKGE